MADWTDDDKRAMPLLVRRFVTRLRQPCNLYDSACDATNGKRAFMMRLFAWPNV